MIQGIVRLLNNSSLPVIIPKHRHFANISLVSSGMNIFKPSDINTTNTYDPLLRNRQLPDPYLYPGQYVAR